MGYIKFNVNHLLEDDVQKKAYLLISVNLIELRNLQNLRNWHETKNCALYLSILLMTLQNIKLCALFKHLVDDSPMTDDNEFCLVEH